GLTLHADLDQHQEFLSGFPEAAFIENLPDGDFKAALALQGAALVFPLRTADATNGLVVLGARPGDLRYSEADLEFGAGLVAQAGVAFANSWYVRETLERKKLEQELALAASIQEKLFPDQMPKLDGYDLAAHNLPARQCGGDYYDALPIDGTDASSAVRPHLFCVADVSGKGLPASLLMSNVQATLRALLGRTPSLADLAARINELMYATTPGNKYVTAVMVEFDPASGAVRYVNAGHNGGVLVRGDGEHEWLKPTGTPLGLIAGLPYEEAHCELHVGDLLALFSDGIPEAQDTSENEFGEERLVEYLRQARHQSAAGIVAGAFEQVSEFAGTAPQYDDITLLVIKRTA
ncbi:MAG: PP2C family protein-serine/threonine phosphatase, partial [Acidobacteriota bacterium]|nr:PP2C family protein-serine/threonine phosphatase [Acidobacteriota bacterium]